MEGDTENDPVEAFITINDMPDRKIGLIMRTIKEERARRIGKLASLSTESIMQVIRDETHIEPYNEADLSRLVEARVSAALQNVIAEELFDRAVRCYRHKNGKPSPETLAAVSKSRRFDPDSL